MSRNRSLNWRVPLRFERVVSPSEFESLPRQKFPAAVLLGPYLQHADVRGRGLSGVFVVYRRLVAHDRVVAGNGGRRLGQGNRLVDRLLVDDGVDELRLAL